GGAGVGAPGRRAGTPRRRPRRARLFWGLLAVGPLLYALPALVGAVAPGVDVWGEHHVVAEAMLGGASLFWAAALLVRPDRPRPRGSALVPLLGGAAVLVL